MFRAADNLRPVNMPQCDVVRGWKVLRRKGVQRTDINVTYSVTFTGANGGQMPGRNDGQVSIATQRAGVLILLLVIVGDRPSRCCCFLVRLALRGNDVTWS